MNNKRNVIAVLILVSYLQFANALSLGIMDIVPKNGVSRQEASVITDIVYDSAYKYNKKNMTIIARDQRESILKEIEFSLSEMCDEVNCAVRVGKYLSADNILTGSISRLGDRMHLTVRIIDVTTTEILASNRVEFSAQNYDLFDDWVNYCVGILFNAQIGEPIDPTKYKSSIPTYPTYKKPTFIDFMLEPSTIMVTGTLSCIVGFACLMTAYDLKPYEKEYIAPGFLFSVPGVAILVYGIYKNWASE